MLTHWGRDKMFAISQTTLSNAFSWMEMLEFRFKFHWSLLLRVQLTIFQHCLRWWLGADQVTSHYLNQRWVDYRRIYASLGLNESIYNVIKKHEYWFHPWYVHWHLDFIWMKMHHCGRIELHGMFRYRIVLYKVCLCLAETMHHSRHMDLFWWTFHVGLCGNG